MPGTATLTGSPISVRGARVTQLLCRPHGCWWALQSSIVLMVGPYWSTQTPYVVRPPLRGTGGLSARPARPGHRRRGLALESLTHYNVNECSASTR